MSVYVVSMRTSTARARAHERCKASSSPNHANESDGTIIVQVSALTDIITKSNGVLPRLTPRLSVFTRAVTNRLVQVSPFHRTVWFSFRAALLRVQCRNVQNVTKGRIRALGIPDRFLRICGEARNAVTRIQYHLQRAGDGNETLLRKAHLGAPSLTPVRRQRPRHNALTRLCYARQHGTPLFHPTDRLPAHLVPETVPHELKQGYSWMPKYHAPAVLS